MENDRIQILTIESLRKYSNVDCLKKVDFVNLSIEDIFGALKIGAEIKFDNCTFDLSEDRNVTGVFISNCIFSNCTFKNTHQWRLRREIDNEVGKCRIEFCDSEFEDSLGFIILQNIERVRLYFTNCIIKKYKEIYVNNAYDGRVNLHVEVFNCSKIGKLTIQRLESTYLALYNVDIANLELKDSNVIYYSNITNIEKVVMKNVNVTTPMHLSSTSNYEFQCVTFDKTLVTQEQNNDETKQKSTAIIANDCLFNDCVNLSVSVWKKICMTECTFSNKLIITHASATELDFSGSKFKDSVKIFNNRSFIEIAKFAYCTINGLFLFNGWNMGTLKFGKNAIIDFSNVFINKDAYVIVRRINPSDNLYNQAIEGAYGKFDFRYSNILGAVVFADVKAQSLDLQYSSIVGRFNVDNIDLKYQNPETACRLKNEEIKRNNTIEALKYKAIEYDLHRASKIGIWDKMLLWLNKNSNNHGKSWVRGVVFNIVVAFIFYSLYSFSIGNLEWSMNFKNWIFFKEEYWKGVLNFFWLPNLDGFKELANSKTTIVSYVWFIMGKVFIGYGVYQTISAFRKYGK